MRNIRFLTATLLATALTLGASNTQLIEDDVQLKVNSISSLLAQMLQDRGLTEEASYKIANSFLNTDEHTFTYMLKNIEQGSSVLSEKEILVFLSTQALQRKTAELDSYSYLVNMTHRITNRALSSETLNELERIALKNSLYLQLSA